MLWSKIPEARGDVPELDNQWPEQFITTPESSQVIKYVVLGVNKKTKEKIQLQTITLEKYNTHTKQEFIYPTEIFSSPANKEILKHYTDIHIYRIFETREFILLPPVCQKALIKQIQNEYKKSQQLK